MVTGEYGYNLADDLGEIIVFETRTGETLDIMDYSVAELLSQDSSQEYLELMLDKQEFQGIGRTEVEQESLAREVDALNNSGYYQATAWDANHDKNGLVVLGGYTPDKKLLFEFTEGLDFFLHQH